VKALVAVGCGIVVALLASQPPRAGDPDPGLVVIDPGHGGPDYGARGPGGALEKDVVLAVSKRLGPALERDGFRVVYTRRSDTFVSLPERTELANRARAGLYLSIHANASDDHSVRGAETYFLSLNASDEEARQVALTENRVFDHPEAVPDGGDVVGSILGDMIRTDHLRVSSEVAFAIQRQLDALSGESRGVKQAPFVVLMGVNMPAALLEIGFLTHREEERNLADAEYQAAIATAVAAGVRTVRDASPPAGADDDEEDEGGD
jgi:N-acetylmuramoyl-L-alanine amidase